MLCWSDETAYINPKTEMNSLVQKHFSYMDFVVHFSFKVPATTGVRSQMRIVSKTTFPVPIPSHKQINQLNFIDKTTLI